MHRGRRLRGTEMNHTVVINGVSLSPPFPAFLIKLNCNFIGCNTNQMVFKLNCNFIGCNTNQWYLN